MLRQIILTRSTRPGQSVGRRAGTLVATSGPYPGRIERGVAGSRVRRTALGGGLATMRVAMATGPHAAVERAAEATGGGAPDTPERAAAQRRTVLAGTAATVAVGLALQRAINHSTLTGPVAEVGRLVGSQLAIGGAATALVMGTDALRRAEERDSGERNTALTIGGMAVLAQSRMLRKLAPTLTLPTAPATVAIPVRGRWRTRTVELPLSR